MRSVGLNLDRWVKKGLLRIHGARPRLHGLEPLPVVPVLEDHADSRELLVQASQNSGATVAAFGAARDAFAALDRVRPAVIVADIALPDEDGYSFIR